MTKGDMMSLAKKLKRQLERVDKGNAVDVVYVDFQKACDKVSCKRFMTKRGYQRFRRIARIVKTICGINLVLKGYIQQPKVMRWVAYHLTRQSDHDKELLFNIHNFTKNKSERDSAKLKSLLSILPHLRSRHETALIQSLLRKNRAFQVMPHIVQLEICQAVVYQQHEAKTIIVREGHPPEACYFVFTGKLAAKPSDGCSINQNHLTEVLNEIEEGDLFGDAALLTNTKRPATIFCKTNAELLLINKEDFESILARFLQQRYSAVTDLLRSLPIFTPWAPEKLMLLSHSSLLRYYRSGTAVIPESYNSSFIVVIKSGRCDIVTNLRMDQCGDVWSQRSQQKKRATPLKDFPALSLLEEETKLIEKSPKRPSTSPSFALVGAQEATKIQQTRKSRCTAMTTPSHSVLKKSNFEELEHKDESLSSRSANPIPEAIITSAEDSNEIQEDTESFGNNEEDEQHNKRKKDPSRSMMRPPEYPRSTFVKIGSLEQGGIFGLTEIPGSTCNLRLSLVSDGAECIFIPKQFFLGEAPAKSRQAALELVNTYPTEQIIRQNFVRQQEWNSYKARLVSQLLGDSTKRRPVSVKPGKTTF
ncbi:cyclic nucleotide-binding domain-containing protein 2-like [Heptranchias perlo]|uniref:cyclic nucleotide-binding domain-containing protein 2-like n=1 Tax=Heptranchias perlo TaxID=212740 RepID=UPI00355A8FBF